MNKSVHPLVALGVIFFYGTLLGIKFWCDHQYLTLDRLWDIKLSPQNELVIQLGEQLIFSSVDGTHLHSIQLNDFGIAQYVGDFSFFSNGDLLIAHNKFGLTAMESMQAFLRGNFPERDDGDSRLQRCSLRSMTCHEFSEELPAFRRAFRLSIDTIEGRVYVADTRRHQLWLLDTDGNLLSKRAGFKFPNHLERIGDHLWLADTNNHQIKQLQIQPDNFAEELNQHDVQLEPPYRWPFAFAQLNENWWVIIGGNRMANGRVVVYDRAWTKMKELDLPESADPIALLKLDNRLLIADNRHFRIYQFDSDGNPLPDFVPEALIEKLESLRLKASQWKFYSRSALGAFIVTFIIGFAFAVRQQLADKREARNIESRHLDQVEIPQEIIRGLWVEPSRIFRVAPYLLLVMPLVTLAILYFPGETKLTGSFGLFILSSMFLFMFIPLRRLGRLKLGIYGDHLEVITYSGKQYSASYEHVLWNPRALVIEKLVVPVGGSGQAKIFSADILKKYLRPRLHPKNMLSDWAMMRYQWRSEDGLQKYSVVMVLVVLVIYLLGVTEY